MENYMIFKKIAYIGMHADKYIQIFVLFLLIYLCNNVLKKYIEIYVH